MSESETYEELSVSSDGVTVTKRYEADEFPVPAIAFNFESTRGEPVTVTLSDAVPEDIAVEDLGFHPEYGSEHWNIEDEEISFEREIEPGTEYTTVYGIRATGTDNVEQFLSEPTLERVDPPLEEDEGALVGDGDDAVKDVISGDADSVPGLDEEDEDVETLDLKDPTGAELDDGDEETGEPESGSTASGSTDSADAADSSDSTGGATANGDASTVELNGDTLVGALANELREQQVSKDDVNLLRKGFDLAADDAGSVKARVEKLQTEVSEVIAYTDALEEFLDENGTAEDMIAEFRSDLETFQSQVDDFETRFDALEDDVVTDEDLAAIEGNVTEVENQVETVASSVDSVEETVDDLDEELEGMREELEEIGENVSDGDTEARIDEIEAEIVELKEWREQLSTVIGGAE